MYLDLFQLKALPFRLSPDPQYLYLSAQHAAVRQRMAAALAEPQGVLVITGDTGVGKTSVIERFLAELDSQVVVARLNQTQMTALGFLQGLLVQFGFAPFSMTRAELLVTIDAFLLEQQAAGRRVLLLVDEAQQLSAAVLEEVRRLATLEGPSGPALAIVLAGQPGLADALESPALAALAALARTPLHLTALPPDEIGPYIQHRLDVAGAAGRTLFDAPALTVIRRYTGGLPRLINMLCDTALMNAYEQHHDHVGAAEVEAAIQTLRWVEYAARSQPRPRAAAAPPVPAHLPASAQLAPLGYLQVALDGRTVAALELRPGRVLIGRTSENDLQIDSKFISRHHCQVTVTPESATIEDLNSTNGLTLRGERVRRHALVDGDVVMVGQHALTYQAAPPADASL